MTDILGNPLNMQYELLLPEIILAITALLVVFVDAFKREGAFESVGLLIDRVLWPQRILAHKIADIVR